MNVQKNHKNTAEIKLDRPFFISCSPSSGSTLLGVILDSHPELACGTELHITDRYLVYSNFEKFRNNIHTWVEEGLSTGGFIHNKKILTDIEYYGWSMEDTFKLIQSSKNMREFLDGFFTPFLTFHKKKIWGEKSVCNAYHFDRILQLYPKAKIIHILRDGRDVMCSLLGKSRNPFFSASAWLFNIAAAHKYRNSPNYLLIKYEDLVQDTTKTLELVCKHIGVDYSSDMIDNRGTSIWKSFDETYPRESWQHNPVTSPISPSSIGRYKKDLNRENENFFWHLHLTKATREKLESPFSNTIAAMQYFKYIDQDGIPELHKVKERYHRMELNYYRLKVLTDDLYEKRNWIPHTYIG
jgi:hypothetical protein